MQTVVKSRFWTSAEPACPCSHPPGLIQAEGEGGEGGREIVSGGVAQLATPAWVRCSGLRGRVAAFVTAFYFFFMIYFMISCNHVTFHKFFTFHKSCHLRSVRVSVPFDAATCSWRCCWEPGSHWGPWALLPATFSLLPALTGSCCPAMVTEVVPAASAPSHLLDHL